MRNLVLFFVIIFLTSGCNDNYHDEEDFIVQSELNAQKTLIDSWYKDLSIEDLALVDNQYEIKLSDGNNFSFTNIKKAISDVIESESDYSFYFSDSSRIDIRKESTPALKKFKNNPFPISKNTLKVLAIGNSYTEDANAYLRDICRLSGIDQNRFCIYEALLGGSSLQTWTEKYKSRQEIEILQTAGNIEMPVTKGTLKSILSQDWDIIIVQQLSKLSTDYSSFNPYLKKLINLIREDCSNPKLAFAWQLIWSYKSDYGDPPYGIIRWEKICEVVEQQISNDGIDIIIPTGTAIQNARNTSLQTDGELTRDGTHLSFGTGRYIAACVWFETLLKPLFNRSIIGNKAQHSLSSSEIRDSKYKSISVTSENAALCQKCAANAVKNRFTITPVEN